MKTWKSRHGRRELWPRMKGTALRSSGPSRGLVRPGLRPVGLLAASLGIAAVVSFLTAAAVTAVVDEFAKTAATSFPGLVIGKTIAILIILAFSKTDFGLRGLLSGPWKRAVLLGCLLGVLLFVSENVIDSDGKFPLATLPSSTSLGPVFAVMIAFVCLLLAVSGFLEEILFRGIIQSSCHQHYRTVPAIVLTAVLFAAPHAAFGWIATIELLGVGLFLSWYRWKYGSLWFPVAVHATHNMLYGLALGLAI